MAITKKIIQKDAQGNVIEVDIGANATNITEDSKHRFVTDAEKESWSTKQNVFSNITVGSTTIAADNTTDTLTLVEGSNVTLTADAAGDKVTISATNTVYTHPDTPGNKHIPSGGGSGQILKWSADGTASWYAIGNSALNCLKFNTASNVFGPTTSFSGFNTSYSAMEDKINNCEYSLFLGTMAGISSPNGSYITCIGDNANATGSNQVQLGGPMTTTYTYGAVQNRSDRRDKADVENTDIGLEFIKKLRPVKFRWNYREDYTEYIETQQENGEVKLEKIEHENDGSKKRKRFHQGLIAQEVKETMDKLGVDFGGYQDHNINNGKDVLSIGYEELIPVLIKAVQEQQQQIDDLTRIIREK